MKNEPYDLDALRAVWQPCCQRVDSLLQASDRADYRLPSCRDLRRQEYCGYAVNYAVAAAVAAFLLPVTVAAKPLPYNLDKGVQYEATVELIQETLLS